MANPQEPFKPGFAEALMKLDPEDGEQIVEYFKTQALLMREKALLQASVREQKKLLVENAKLKSDIEDLRGQLQDKQRRAPPLPRPLSSAPATEVAQSPSLTDTDATMASGVASGRPLSSSLDQRERQSRRRRGERKARPISDPCLLQESEPQVDISRLDLRVGRILSARRHPLAEALLVQEVDMGEAAPRTVVSKLGEETDVEEIQGGLAVLLCNVKACKLKGVVSQARLLCCSSSDECMELLVPPSGSVPGDRITFHNYPGDPDRELQSKQRVWDQLKSELLVDCKGVANYKGCSFEVKGKGLCRAPTLTNCTIR
ncbi:aminoacyl tRNA synthase complex-interacting multifunctional protein 1 [Genypterus blacodes]|uniref:aminoacyl tRNA synthase complex-interacting multifunctional protein 1 n=1 Tax=Genypterus blacodes TaxID=154954 RepID=UPI003F7673B0